MIEFSRSDRVSGLIQEVLSDILKKEIADPRLQMTTITGVKMSADLKLASIYYTTSGDKNSINAAAQAFNRAHGYIKKKLAQQLELRYMPQLRFFYDESLDYGSRIEKLLKTVSTKNGTNHRTN
jgi:ribosome-binding factor A